MDAPGKVTSDILASTSNVGIARKAVEHALVVGGGISGLFAARILADHCERVTLLERDALSDRPDMRAKTPQSPHSHVLSSIGYRKVTQLFPGLDQDLAAAGALRFDFYGDCRHHAGNWLPRFSSGLVSRMCTRMLLEHAIRRRLSDIANVVIRDRQRVEQMLVREDGSRVTGVRLKDGSELHADLVVDAAGLGSRTSHLVKSLGFGDPEVERIDLLSATATRLFRPPPGMSEPDWVAVFVRATAQNRRIGALTRIEGGLWRVSLAGLGDVYPPKTEDGFLTFTRELPNQEIHRLIRDAEPVSGVHYYGASFSRWIRYDKLPRFPDGLVVVGDAAFHANPEHAQGMTFCLLAAEMLGAMLAESGRPQSERVGFSLEFQRRIAEKYRPYWVWNAAVELDIPGVVDGSSLSRRERLERVIYKHLRSVAPRDPELLRTASRVTQGECHPSVLFHPATLLRLARGTLRARVEQH
jgi:2-polyprenyl-6-methoxyphenol hydroxylase-like FAD-dependent oxidoreductase